MRRLLAAMALTLLMSGHARAQSYPSPTFATLHVQGLSSLLGGGALAGTFTGAPTFSGGLTITGGPTGLFVSQNGYFGGSLVAAGGLQLGGNATLPLQAVPLQQMPPGVVVPPGGSIQAAHDALPSTGGSIILAANTTYILNARLTITKPNVTIEAPSWGTIIQRGPSLTSGQTVLATGGATKFIFKNITVDGNAPTVSGGNSEIECDGAGSLFQHVQVINPNGIGITLAGVGSRADDNTIVGLNSATIGSYGIWAINHQRVSITHNHISATRLEGIGFDGQGSVVSGNYVAGTQVRASPSTVGGGQIVQYPGYAGTMIEGNTIDQGGGSWAYGIELNGPDTSVIGNTVINQNNIGIGVNASSGNGLLIAANTILNSGKAVSTLAGQGSGITFSGPLTNVTVTGNRIADTQGSHTQSWGVFFYTGSYSNIVISNNDLTGNVNGALAPSGATHQLALNNLGVDDVSGSTVNVIATGSTTSRTLAQRAAGCDASSANCTFIDAKDYGASPANSAAQNTTAFQAAVTAACAVTNHTALVWVGAGYYNVEVGSGPPFNIGCDSVSVMGAGVQNTTFFPSGDGDVFAIISAAPAGYRGFNTLSNFRVFRNDHSTSGAAIHLSNTQAVRINNITVDGSFYGLWIESSLNTFVESFYAGGKNHTANSALWKFDKAATLGNNSSIFIVNSSATSGVTGADAYTYGIVINNMDGLNVANSHAGFTKDAAVFINPGATTDAVDGLFFTNFGMDTAGYGLKCVQPGGSTPNLVNVNISNSFVYNSTHDGVNLACADLSEVMFSNVAFDHNGENGLAISAGKQMQFPGVIFDGSNAANGGSSQVAISGGSAINLDGAIYTKGYGPFAAAYNINLTGTAAGISAQNQNFTDAATADVNYGSATKVIVSAVATDKAALPNQGVTASLGGASLAQGACTSGTAAVANSQTTNPVTVQPTTYPGDGVYWLGYVSAAGTVTVKVCGATVVVPTASTYNVSVVH